MSNNNISGLLRASWAGLPSLTLLDVSFNNFNGTVPGSLFRAPLLETALLQDNSLTGALPASQGELPEPYTWISEALRPWSWYPDGFPRGRFVLCNFVVGTNVPKHACICPYALPELFCQIWLPQCHLPQSEGASHKP